MNFSETVKKELISKQVKDKHCKKAFLAGLIRGTGELYEKDGELGIDVRVSNEETAMLVSSFFKSVFDYEIREVSVSEDRLNKRDKIILSIYGQKGIEILKDLERKSGKKVTVQTVDEEKPAKSEVERIISDLDINNLSPMQAFAILADLKEKL
jgi:DNA-binding protein WhiA